jgi:predicted ATPase
VILDLLERLCNLPSETILECSGQFAPSWLASLPMLASSAERPELARQTLGTTPERRMHEIAAFLEDMSRTQRVVLVIEDLHWVDPSTLALISFLARRREAARLMVIVTYCEDEVERWCAGYATAAARRAGIQVSIA